MYHVFWILPLWLAAFASFDITSTNISVKTGSNGGPSPFRVSPTPLLTSLCDMACRRPWHHARPLSRGSCPPGGCRRRPRCRFYLSCLFKTGYRVGSFFHFPCLPPHRTSHNADYVTEKKSRFFDNRPLPPHTLPFEIKRA